MAFNLHALARGADMTLHPEVPMVAIFCTGFLNDHGQRIMKYGECERISAQKQTLNSDDIQLANEVMQAQMSRKFFLSTTSPLTAGQRHDGEAHHGSMSSIPANSGACTQCQKTSAASYGSVFASQVHSPPPAVIQALRDSGISGQTEDVFNVS